jgi:hypothetical protein
MVEETDMTQAKLREALTKAQAALAGYGETFNEVENIACVVEASDIIDAALSEQTPDERLSVPPEKEVEHALRLGDQLADWINLAGPAMQGLLNAYERRVRSLCSAEELEKRPWECAEFIAARDILKMKPVAVVDVSVPPENNREPVAALMDETFCIKVINVVEGNYWRCPYCRNMQSEGHKADCVVMRLIAHPASPDPLPRQQVTSGQQERRLTVDVQIGGTKIAKGVKVSTALACMNQDYHSQITPPPEAGTPMGESPAQMVMVPRETVERAAQWLECAADSGVQAEYEDGTDTPNRIGLRKACNDLRAAAHEAQRGKA